MTADARRRAEEDLLHVIEWLESGHWMACQPLFADDGAKAREKGQRLRALLAAGPEKVAEPSCGLCQDRAVVNAVSEPSRPVPCPNCWHAPRQSDAGTPCDGTYACRCKRHYVASAPPPPSEAVREAAERLWHSLTPPRSTTDDGMLLVRAEDVEAVLRALASSPAAPAKDAVREAAEVVRTILTAHDARLSESGVLTYGPPSKGTGFVAAIQWLRRYDAARGGE